MGRAFSAHNFSGQLGTAVAPAVMTALAVWFSWKVALITAGLLGLIVMLALTTQWSGLRDDAMPRKKKEEKGESDRAPGQPAAKSGLALLFSRQLRHLLHVLPDAVDDLPGHAVVLGRRAYRLHGISVPTASIALSAYLFTMAFGVLLGGELADRTQRHDVVAEIVFVLSAILMTLIAAVDLGFALLMRP